MIVWIIENEAHLRLLLSTNLKARGYTTLLMEDVESTSIEMPPPVLIFLDVVYDDDGCWTFLDRIAGHAIFCTVPVIITTTIHHELQLSYPNVKYILRKPYGIEEFFNVLSLLGL